MAKTFEGQLSAKGLRIAIVVARFNQLISSKLLEGALDCLKRHGASESDVEVFWVPGSFELPMAANKIAQTREYQGMICLGTLIRGQTPHFDFIAAETTKGIGQVALSTGLPVAYGVITADTIDQAIERAGTKAGNKGWEAALACIEMADLYKKLSISN